MLGENEATKMLVQMGECNYCVDTFLWQIGTDQVFILTAQPLNSKSCRETDAVKKYAEPHMSTWNPIVIYKYC